MQTIYYAIKFVTLHKVPPYDYRGGDPEFLLLAGQIARPRYSLHFDRDDSDDSAFDAAEFAIGHVTSIEPRDLEETATYENDYGTVTYRVWDSMRLADDVRLPIEFGGTGDLERYGFSFEAGSATVGWSEIVELPRVADIVMDAVRYAVHNRANAYGVGEIVGRAMKVGELGATLLENMQDALSVLDYGIRNFEDVSADEYSKRVDRLLGDSLERFLAEAENQLGTNNIASSILRSTNVIGRIEDGEAELTLKNSAQVVLEAPSLVVLSDGATSVTGSSGRDVVVNSGNDGRARPTYEWGLSFGIDDDVGYDRVRLGAGRDVFVGGDAYEEFRGGGGADQANGGRGNDILWGQRGEDRLSGDNGDDILIGGPHADRVYGGGGQNTADYAGSRAGVTINIGAGIASGGDAEGDRLRRITNLGGSDSDDRLVGDGSGNVLAGRMGLDRLVGAKGNDTLEGGGDGDDLFGGGGTDTLSYYGSKQGVYVVLSEEIFANGDAEGDRVRSIENVTGSLRNDVIHGDNGANFLDGLA